MCIRDRGEALHAEQRKYSVQMLENGGVQMDLALLDQALDLSLIHISVASAAVSADLCLRKAVHWANLRKAAARRRENGE